MTGSQPMPVGALLGEGDELTLLDGDCDRDEDALTLDDGDELVDALGL